MGDMKDILSKMRKAGKVQDMTGKGDLGEEAALRVILDRRDRMGCGLIYHSFLYPYQTNSANVCYTGNVVYQNEVFVEHTRDSISDEIDILYVTPYRIIPIEVKSYGGKTLSCYDWWFNRASEPVEKSPIAQAEKHARHLYHAIHSVLPDGDPNYIKPIVCFVDKCKVHDERSDAQKEYIPVCILNNLSATINKYSTPLKYNIDIPSVKEKLNNVKTSVKRCL